MNYWHNLANSGLLIGLAFLVPITSSAAPSPKEPIAISELKPLEGGIVLPDKPLPAEDIKPLPSEDKPLLEGKCLSEFQIGTMKTILQDVKKAAIQGKLDEATDKFNEFAGGPWEEASKELKINSPTKYNDIEAKIGKIDTILSSQRHNVKTKSRRLKFIQEVTNLINAVVRAGKNC
jgi:hypothetical protein